MAVTFYDVKTRQKVDIDDKSVMKTTFTTKNGQVRFGLRGKTDDNRMLTKFVSKTDWETMGYPEEKKDEPKKAEPKKAEKAEKPEKEAKKVH